MNTYLRRMCCKLKRWREAGREHYIHTRIHERGGQAKKQKRERGWGWKAGRSVPISSAHLQTLSNHHHYDATPHMIFFFSYSFFFFLFLFPFPISLLTLHGSYCFHSCAYVFFFFSFFLLWVTNKNILRSFSYFQNGRILSFSNEKHDISYWDLCPYKRGSLKSFESTSTKIKKKNLKAPSFLFLPSRL